MVEQRKLIAFGVLTGIAAAAVGVATLYRVPVTQRLPGVAAPAGREDRAAAGVRAGGGDGGL